MKTKILLGVVAVLASFGVATGAAGSPPHVATIDRDALRARVDNPWFPLLPGTRWEYTGVKEGRTARDVVSATDRTTRIDGAACVAVRDRLYLDGRLRERTTDWYTQDRSGNVWYFGERTAELDARGRVVSTAGSWQAGVDGAGPGIFMPAHPRVGQSFRQELYVGRAEDRFEVIGLFGAVTTPPARSALLTKEWTPLEPGVVDHKLYVRGIGTVVERTVHGGDELLELLSVRRGP